MSTPMAPNEKLQEDESEEFADPGLFRSIIGRLLYITHTRLDIIFSVNFQSRFMSKTHKRHFSVVKRVLRYPVGSVNLGL